MNGALGLLSVRFTVSVGSTVMSSKTVMVNVWLVWPGANVSVPETGV